jgi:ER membrane protein complex subunit 4
VKNSITPEAYNALKEKRAWDFAISPAKSLPMQAFMLYMSGGGVQIFSIGIVFMLLFTPFKNLAAINEGASVTILEWSTR